MKACACIISALLLVASPSTSRGDPLPIVFARSGQKTLLRLRDGKLPGERVALLAYGRPWGEAARVEDGSVRLVTPAVRVPTVFRIVPVRDDKIALAELVVYPEGWIAWDKDKRLSKYQETQFVAAGAPDWLDGWLSAVQFPVERLPGRESLERDHWRRREKPGLLILGRTTAGRGPAEVGRLAIDHRANVLVIEADWLGPSASASGNLMVTPKHARGALIDLQTQQWPLPPGFGRQALPWPVVWNRRAWLDGGEYPLVEEVYSRQKGGESLRIVFNYLPWQEQLGRCEVADELLLRILAEAAKGAGDRASLNHRWCLLYPATDKIKVEERPVLFAAVGSAVKVGSDGPTAAAAEPSEVRGYVLDLRGGSPLPDELFAESGVVKSIEPRINEQMPLLILGENRRLDTWEWLELDRRQQKSPRPGVCWFPDSSLPPSLGSQLRVMDVFTRWGVFLKDISQETSHENRENEL